jgi:aminoglycoside phosphotransferase (APT) family kinase protein
MTFGADAYEWLVRSIGPSTRILDIVQMKGSTSSSVFFIQCSDGSNPQRFVLRVVDNQDWLAEEPDLAEHEAAALEEAQRANLRAPYLVAYSSEDVGFGAPVVLMSLLEGTIDLRPADFKGWLDGLANELALIHQHTAPTFRWDYTSWVERATLAPPEWTTISHVWERAIELALHTAPNFYPVYIHRDYHPTNVLWHKGALSGVVDWITACRGPAGVDVAHCRINLAKMFGIAAADQFLETYSEVSEGFEYNPYWDVDSLLDTCIPRPKFYPPWRDFGLDIIPPEMLNQRVDTYIESVMERI